MNFRKKIMLVLSSLVLFNILMTAQVTIGSGHTSNLGSLLDLKQEQVSSGANSTKGLLLPRVQLKSATEILSTAKNEEIAHTGLMVYNVGDKDCAFGGLPKGVYIWSGTEWNILGDKSTNMADYVNAAIYVRSIGNENLAGTELELSPNESYILEGHADGIDITYQWSGPGIVTPTPSADGKHTIVDLTNSKTGRYTCTMIDDCGNQIVKHINITMEEPMCSPALDITLAVYLGSNAMTALTPNQAGKYEIPTGEDVIIKATYDASGGTYTYKWSKNKGNVVIGSSTDTECIVESLPSSVSEVTLTLTAKDNKAIGCNQEYPMSVTLVKKAEDPNCTVPANTFTLSGSYMRFEQLANKRDFLCSYMPANGTITIRSSVKISNRGWQDHSSGVGSVYTHQVSRSSTTEVLATVNGCTARIIFAPIGVTTICDYSQSSIPPGQRTIGAALYLQERGTTNMVEYDKDQAKRKPTIGVDVVLQGGVIFGGSGNPIEHRMLDVNDKNHMVIWTVESGVNSVNGLYDDDDFLKGNMMIRINAKGTAYPLPINPVVPQTQYRIGFQIIELESNCAFSGTVEVQKTK